MADLIFARPDGQWFDFPPLKLAAMSGDTLLRPGKLDLIPLPPGATLTLMPTCAPVGFDPESGEYLQLDENPYKKKSEKVFAVAALLPQGYTRLYLPAATDSQELLPILGYTAVGVEKGRLVCAALPTDEPDRWDPRHFNGPELEGLVEKRLAEFPDNRVIRQLAKCSLEYGCFTAQNIFYRRWEGGLPASPACNAECMACLSLQPEDSCDSPQQRINFCPQAKELAEIGAAHLAQAKHAIVSFGQGCEGEPSLAFEVIAAAIAEMRRQTRRGLININTNAGHTRAVRALLEAGIDSLRVSMFSAVKEDYEAYHRPKDYAFEDVLASLAACREAGRPVALNLLAWPGFTDDPAQRDALIGLCREYKVRQIQMRNLNCDPRLMRPFCAGKSPVGMRMLLRQLSDALPDTDIGSYSKDLRQKAKKTPKPPKDTEDEV